MLTIAVNKTTKNIIAWWNENENLTKPGWIDVSSPDVVIIEDTVNLTFDMYPFPEECYEIDINNNLVLKSSISQIPFPWSYQQLADAVFSVDFVKEYLIRKVYDVAFDVRDVLKEANIKNVETYTLKAIEAKEFLSDITQQETNFPILYQEVQQVGGTMENLATTVLSKFIQWKQRIGEIEGIRLKAKMDILNAIDKESAFLIEKNATNLLYTFFN